MRCFANKEEMKPLLDLCRQGRLFEVQEWIAAGNPVNPPPAIHARKRIEGPLEIAIKTGFHSLVKVLLEGGAHVTEPNHSGSGGFCAMSAAVHKRRLDIIELLMQHGASVEDVSMWEVFNTWDRDIMRYFIDHGADVISGDPLAEAFCSKVQRALRVYKEYETQIPDWKRQLNSALRFHTKTRDEKWVSLMLWAGADPYEPGPGNAGEPDDDDRCAIEIALNYGWTWMLKKVAPLTPSEENVCRFLSAVSFSGDLSSMEILAKDGFLLRATAEQQSELISGRIHAEAFTLWQKTRHSGKNSGSYGYAQRACFNDGILEFLLQNDMKWTPSLAQMKSDRRSLLEMGAPGFRRFVRLLKKYDGASKEVLHELTRTGTIQRLLQSER